MDIKSIRKKGSLFLKKYKYVALVVLLGMILMLVPGKQERGTVATETTIETTPNEESIEQQLTKILSQIQGAGNVQVMLTIAEGPETIYQVDSDTSVSDDSSTSQVKTVIITSSQKEQLGVVRQKNPPIYKGAIIVCEGAESPAVQLAIVDAVSVVTGLGADKITVLKMK